MREMSEKEYQHLHGKVSIKSIYEKKKGKEVTLDHFLFTCHDTSKQLSALEYRMGSSHWPGLLEDPSDTSLEEGVKEMVSWYKQTYPNLNLKGALDVSKVVHVAKNLAYLEKDFKDFVKMKTGDHLEDHLLDQNDLTPPWTYLKQNLIMSFSKIGDKIWTYFTWAYGISPPSEVVNISEVPPVSRFRYQEPGSPSFPQQHPQQNRSQPSRGRQQRKGSGNSSGNSKDKSAGYQGGHKKRHNSGHKKAAGGFGAKDRTDRTKDKAKKKEVLALVDKSIQQLEEQNLSEIQLAPQNSFYRRIQHKYIVDRGFASKSCGNDQSRAVKIISRKKK